jgi:hypothetical protein
LQDAEQVCFSGKILKQSALVAKCFKKLLQLQNAKKSASAQKAEIICFSSEEYLKSVLQYVCFSERKLKGCFSGKMLRKAASVGEG